MHITQQQDPVWRLAQAVWKSEQGGMLTSLDLGSWMTDAHPFQSFLEFLLCCECPWTTYRVIPQSTGLMTAYADT
jgi:hypothetical protein